jgi:hypothetical protein
LCPLNRGNLKPQADKIAKLFHPARKHETRRNASRLRATKIHQKETVAEIVSATVSGTGKPFLLLAALRATGGVRAITVPVPVRARANYPCDCPGPLSPARWRNTDGKEIGFYLCTAVPQPRDTPRRFWTAVAERSGDTAFGRKTLTVGSCDARRCESGVALRFPPQSKKFGRAFAPLR